MRRRRFANYNEPGNKKEEAGSRKYEVTGELEI